MPREHVIGMDPSKPLGEEPQTGHNRWHEAIEPVVEVDPGDTVIYETRDAFDGQLTPSPRPKTSVTWTLVRSTRLRDLST